MAKKEKILDRIQKLLALSKSSNEHEAASAAAQAQKLILEHQISEEELKTKKGRVAPVGRFEICESTRAIGWRIALAGGVCHGLGAQFYYQDVESAVRIGAKKAHYYGIGPKSTENAVKYLYTYLVKEVDRLATAAYKKEGKNESAFAWKNAFKLGAAHVIAKRLAEQRKETIGKVDKKSTALVRLEKTQKAVEQFVKKLGLRMGGRPTVRSKSGLEAGERAGAKVNLGGNRGLSTGVKRLRG